MEDDLELQPSRKNNLHNDAVKRFFPVLSAHGHRGVSAVDDEDDLSNRIRT